jgi:hypothetical protein
MAGVDHTDEERLRHAIASEALSELSQLSSYRPDSVSPAPVSRLVRRTPASASASAASPVAAADAAVVGGTAAEAASEAGTDAAATSAVGTWVDTGVQAGTGVQADAGAGVHADGWAHAQAGTVSGPTTDAVPAGSRATARPRDADQLRRMLSGFQAGVRRGRGVQDSGKPTIGDGDERRTSS